jgi:hypothetical protein
MKTLKHVVYCIVPREDFKGVFYTIDTVTPGGSGGSTPFDQKPDAEQIAAYLRGIYPDAETFTWCTDHSLTAEEIAARFF